jgi:5-methylcytosine-specific restriction protein A
LKDSGGQELNFEHSLNIGDTITNSQLMKIFKCGPQGGMRRSLDTKTLVLISDPIQSVYDDRWISNEILHYTGIGLEGDQRIDYSQNKTLAESALNDVSLFLFEVYEKGRYLYRGRIELCDQPYQAKQPDKKDQLRKVWIFPIKIVTEDSYYNVPDSLIEKKQKIKEKRAKKLSDKELFLRAVHSNKQPVNRQVSATTFESNIYVAELVKRRANGTCQLCDNSAPFTDQKGEPFLEFHHIVRLSKGGEDTIENTVALCPNCHRKMHRLNLKSDFNKLKEEAKKNCCQLTINGDVIFV